MSKFEQSLIIWMHLYIRNKTRLRKNSWLFQSSFILGSSVQMLSSDGPVWSWQIVVASSCFSANSQGRVWVARTWSKASMDWISWGLWILLETLHAKNFIPLFRISKKKIYWFIRSGYICASAPVGNDRKQAGKRSDMKHCVFLGVLPVTRNSNGLCCISLEVNMGVYWSILSQVCVSDLL